MLLIALPWLLLVSRTTAELCVTGIGLHFLISCWRRRYWHWLAQPWCIAAWLFFIYLIAINSPLSQQPLDSALHSLLFLRWPLFACALANLWLHQTHLRHIFLLSLGLAASLLMLDCLWQYISGTDWLGHARLGDRLTGPYHAPLPGIMLLRVVFIANLLWLGHLHANIRHTGQWLTFMACVLILMMTGERMALLLYGLGMMLIVAAIAYGHASLRRSMVTGLLTLTLATIAFSLWMPTTGQRAITSTFVKLSQFGDSDYGLVFRAAIAAWQQHPWLGNGLHTYREVCDSMGLLAGWGMFCTHPHNLYLLLAADSGVIGLGLFIYMVIRLSLAILRPVYRARQWWLLGNLAAILSVSFFPLIGGISLWNNWVAALTWTGVGCALAISRQYATLQHLPAPASGSNQTSA